MARNKATRLPDYPVEQEAKAESHQFVFRPKGNAQKEAVELWKRCKVLGLLGCAGTGKTMVALALAIQEVLAGRCRKIMLARPLVENGRGLGYFPGEIDAKLMPWLTPFKDVAECCIGGRHPWESLQKMLKDAGCELELCAVEMLQGRNVRGILIVDEVQNLSVSQVNCVLTRFCEGGRVIVCGDHKQRNLPGDSPIIEAFGRLAHFDTVAYYQFTSHDVVRDPLVGEIARCLMGD